MSRQRIQKRKLREEEMQGGIMTIEQGEEGAGRVKVSDMNGRVIGGGHQAEHF